MAKVECCHHCVYARWDPGLWLRTLNSVFPAGPVCANQPDFPGRMKECPFGRVCRNFRAKPTTPKGETVKTIPLGGGLVAYVDAADYEWLSQWTWHPSSGYAVRREKGKVILMHRQIMQPPQGMVVHHKNHSRSDNTRENMENVTHAENMRDRSKSRNASSRFWGVSYTRQCAKYQASAHYKGKAVTCGWFTDEIEAARAHDYKAVELGGEAARLNFPDEWPPERRAQVYTQGAATRRRAKAANPRATNQAESPKTKDQRQRTDADGKTKKAKSKTPAARRKTKPKRATKKAHAETQGRRGGRGQTRAKPVKPRATRDERRATKKATAAKRPKRKAT